MPGNHRRHRERQIDERRQQASCRGKSNFAIAQPAQIPNTQIGGNGNRGGEQRQPERRHRVRLAGWPSRYAPSPVANASMKTVTSGNDQEQRRNSKGHDREAAIARSAARSVPACSAALTRRVRSVTVAVSSPAVRLLQPCSALIVKQQGEGDQQHHQRNRGRSRVVELLELRDDEERRDLGDASAGCRR